MGGGALGGAVGAVGNAVKAAGTDMYNGAKDSLFGVEHPVQSVQNTVQGQAPPNTTDNYANTTIGRLFGAGQPAPAQTPAQRNRQMQATQG